MKSASITGILLLHLVGMTWVFAEEVELTAPEWGVMPTALASVDNMAWRPVFVVDGKADTGWVASTKKLPLWLRLEWRFPVTITEVRFRQSTNAPYPKLGGIGRHTLEVEMDGKWEQVASGNAAGIPSGQFASQRLMKPLTATAIRLVVQSAAGEHLSIAEIEVKGERPVLPLTWAPTWQAVWIWGEPSLQIAHREAERRYLRRTFTVDDPAQVKDTWLIAAGMDRFKMWLNATPGLEDISYSGGMLREALACKIPSTALRRGENVLAAVVDDIYEVGSHGLLAELVMIHQDGTRRVIATDANWRAQADPGLMPQWLQPGFSDAGFVPCKVVATPNSRWHWLYQVAYPLVAPAETMKVVVLDTNPKPVQPGSRINCEVTFEVGQRPKANYAIMVRLGRPSLLVNQDFELWGGQLSPDEAKTSTWEPGRHTVKIAIRMPPESPRLTPATLVVALPQSGVRLESTLPGTKVDPEGLRFNVAVERGGGTRPVARDFPRVEVRTVAGNPALHLDGRQVAPIFWSSSYGNYRRYREYASTGVKLFRPLLAGSVIASPGEEEAHYRRWFAQVDQLVEAALGVDPEIKLLPVIDMEPSPEWLFQNNSEQFLSARGASVIPLMIEMPERGQVRSTFMSQAWRRAGAEGLQRLVRHMRAQPYAGSVIGLMFIAGRGGENYWGGNLLNLSINERGGYDAKPREQFDLGDFSMAARRTFREFLRRKYQTDAALRRAWQRDDIHFDDILEPARFRREDVADVLAWTNKPVEAGSLRDPLQPGVGLMPMDYFQCFSEAMIDSFAEWGRAVKEASDGRLITGCYYGYAMGHLITHVPGFFGHTAVQRANETPYLDVYVSPAEYDDDRRAGGHFWGHNIIDSLRLHNKLWIYECDTRTYLADIQPKTFSRDETLEVLKRDAAAALAKGSGWWWYEFADGQRGARAREWFIDPAIQGFAAQMKRIYDFALTLPDRGPSAEVAVFYHGDTHTAQDVFPPTLALNVSLGRLTLVNGFQRLGAPFDFYNLADVPLLARNGQLKQYKLCLFVNPFHLAPQEVAAIKLCQGGNRTLVWLWAPGLTRVDRSPAAANVSEITGIAGIKLWPQGAELTCRFPGPPHAVTAGLPANYELSPRPFAPGGMWSRFGNKIAPVPYVDPQSTNPDSHVLGYHVLDGQLRKEMGAFCVREIRGGGEANWTSVYCAVPYLSVEMMRNLARMAGAHIYREQGDVLFASRHFVAIHTGREGASDLLRLPVSTGVYDVFQRQRVAGRTNSVRLAVPPYSTALYFLGDTARFKIAVEQ